MVTHFRELRVYRQAFKAAMKIHRLSQHWPLEECYALTDQIRRSSRSVCANTAEAWRKRRYQKHFVSKLSDADAEAAETQSWLDFALACHYISRATYDELDKEYDLISGGLVKMMTFSEQWCNPANLIRDEASEYQTMPLTPTLPHSHTPTPSPLP